LYSGKYFTTNLDVILVTTNYRLGVRPPSVRACMRA
jgi:carboxylesterase type B